MEYEWDKLKATSNLAKHDVSFEEAATVFDDPLYVDFLDPDHSESEQRYIVIGESREGRILFVAYTERRDVIRLISARLTTRTERKAYEKN